MINKMYGAAGRFQKCKEGIEMGNNYLESEIYYRYINSQNNDDLYVLSFGYEKCKPLKSPTLSRQKNNFLIIYVLSGQGEFAYNEISYRLGKEDVFVIYPNTISSYWQDQSDPWEYMWFEFSGIKSKLLLEKAMFSLNNPVYHCKNEKIRDGLLELFDSIQNPLAMELNSLSHLFKLLSQFINDRNFDFNIKLTQKQLSINFVKYYINMNISNNELSLTEISNQIHINPSYLSRIFKAITGTTLSKYIILVRIKKACELLETKLYSIKEITYMVGYSDPHYFSTEFSKYIGICPKKYTNEGIVQKKELIEILYKRLFVRKKALNH